MLIITVGQKGSGKTLWIIREIMKNKHKTSYVNFNLKQKAKREIKAAGGKLIRLKYEHLIKQTPKTFDKDGKPKTYTYDVNWEFWQQAKTNHQISIYIDEAHNIINSRASMIKRTIKPL